MRLRTAVLTAALATTACQGPPSTVAADASPFDQCIAADPADPKLAELMQAARRHVADDDVPGVAIGIAHDGRVDAIATGSRHPLECIPLTAESRFFSLFARHVTAATVIAAAEAGELDLSDPITDHLPTFDVAPPGDPSAITLHHLLTGTAGYPISSLLDCRDVATVLALLDQIPIWSPPGTVHLPQPFDFSLAGNALGDYRAAVDRHVVEPLGLDGTFDRLAAIKGDAATGTRKINDRLDPVDISLVECAISDPYVGYFTGARDAAAFLAALLASDSDALTAHEDAFYPPERATRGGFVRAPLTGEVDWLEAGGRTRGYAYAVRIVPDADFAAVVFMNAGFGDAAAAAEDAVRIFTGYEREIVATPPDTSGYLSLTGTYRESLRGTELVVSIDGEELAASVDGGEPAPLSPATRHGSYVDDVFTLEVGENSHVLRFWRDDDGAGAIVSEDAFRAALGPPFFRVQ